MTNNPKILYDQLELYKSFGVRNARPQVFADSFRYSFRENESVSDVMMTSSKENLLQKLRRNHFKHTWLIKLKPLMTTLVDITYYIEVVWYFDKFKGSATFEPVLTEALMDHIVHTNISGQRFGILPKHMTYQQYRYRLVNGRNRNLDQPPMNYELSDATFRDCVAYVKKAINDMWRLYQPITFP